jgi:hypothetical protein
MCIADMANLRLNARSSDTLEDFCDGTRYARIQATLPCLEKKNRHFECPFGEDRLKW